MIHAPGMGWERAGLIVALLIGIAAVAVYRYSPEFAELLSRAPMAP